ncbi:hypothetical protein [Sinimarinibacterium sp. CAU 1509]|uniref:hypothetical protein n=1 Tax=Sinimarinibacterium sp. CAU 1509 TaxID=2562283 RepID=UPI001B7FA62C|nr:hypothetical protein [Sinimarinibacterium sp. CAU 1509]
MIIAAASAGFFSMLSTLGVDLKVMIESTLNMGPTPTSVSARALRSTKPPPGFDGIDSNRNGVRDDVDAVIASLPDSPMQKKALQDVATAMTNAMALIDWDQSEDAVKAAALDLNTARRCLRSMYTADERAERAEQIRSAVANDQKRMWRLVRFDALAQDYPNATSKTCGG